MMSPEDEGMPDEVPEEVEGTMIEETSSYFCFFLFFSFFFFFRSFSSSSCFLFLRSCFLSWESNRAFEEVVEETAVGIEVSIWWSCWESEVEWSPEGVLEVLFPRFFLSFLCFFRLEDEDVVKDMTRYCSGRGPGCSLKPVNWDWVKGNNSFPQIGGLSIKLLKDDMSFEAVMSTIPGRLGRKELNDSFSFFPKQNLLKECCRLW